LGQQPARWKAAKEAAYADARFEQLDTMGRSQ
jgi:hypothetical protein